ncbi:MAG: hypothetical protein QUS07_01845 [Methanothrix sp.]|nr:hypothetical protein [Methanothrix sp.]
MPYTLQVHDDIVGSREALGKVQDCIQESRQGVGCTFKVNFEMIDDSIEDNCGRCGMSQKRSAESPCSAHKIFHFHVIK